MAACTLYKVLNHCGCCMTATFTNNELSSLLYAYACVPCSQHLPLASFEYYVGLCYDEAVLHVPKVLMDKKGWISGLTYANYLHRKNLHRTAYAQHAKALLARLAAAQGEKLKSDGEAVGGGVPSSVLPTSSDVRHDAPHSNA